MSICSVSLSIFLLRDIILLPYVGCCNNGAVNIGVHATAGSTLLVL